jgi:hypothetical protein
MADDMSNAPDAGATAGAPDVTPRLDDLARALVPWGYAPGDYECRCFRCSRPHVADKRAAICRDCAILRIRSDHDAQAARIRELEAAQQEPPHRFGDLRDFGYAPGGYWHRHCRACQKEFTGDKRAWNCRPCAEAAEFDAAAPTSPKEWPKAAATGGVAPEEPNT